MVDGLIQGRRSRAALTAGALFATVFALRFSLGTFGDAVTFLYVVPIVLVAISWGTGGGVLAGALAFGLFVVWALATDAPARALGYADRAFVFIVVGALVGRFADRLHALEAESARHFSLSEDMICTAGFDGYFKRVNPAFERVLGYSEAELLAKPYLDFVHPDDRGRTAREAAFARNGGRQQFRNRCIDRDGHIRWIEWTSVPIPADRRIYATARDVTARKAIEEDLEQLSRRDPLTGLLNRRSFDEALKRELARAHRDGQPGALLMIDVDQLKQVNDTLGHLAGDQALRAVAAVLRANVREADVLARDQDPDPVTARLGGDEFAVLLPGTGAGGARAAAERLAGAVSAEGMVVEGRQVEVGISIGVAAYDTGERVAPEELLDRADRNMYAAKAGGAAGAAAEPRAASGSATETALT